MKRVKDCVVENCIPTPSSCVEWNGGELEYLGICNGDSLNNILWEIVTKLKEVGGEDLSSYDIDSLLEICNQKAPTEVTIISILNILKNNQLCLKDFIDGLSEQIAAITNSSAVNVNLKCYADFDNLGNSLSITRDTLDQLVIDNLCNHKLRIETLEGKVVSLQSQIDNISTTTTVEELSFDTCLAPGVDKPTSTNVVNLADAHCDLEEATGTPLEVSSALANTPTYPTAVTTDPNYIVGAVNLADSYNNLLLAFANLTARVVYMEENCCAASCKDVELGFTAVYNEDATGVLIKFTAGAGTDIPPGFLDIGSTITITDIDGNVETYTTADPNLIANNAEIEVPVIGLNLTKELTVSIDANMSNGSLTCSKCLTKTVKKALCDYCEICVTGDVGSTVVVIYELTTTIVT